MTMGGQLKSFRVFFYCIYSEYNITEINMHFMLYQPFLGYEGSTVWTKLQAGCEVWKCNLESKQVRAGRNIRNARGQSFPNLQVLKNHLGNLVTMQRRQFWESALVLKQY